MDFKKLLQLRVSFLFALVVTSSVLAAGVLRYCVVDGDYIPVYSNLSKIYIFLSSGFSYAIQLIFFISAIVLRFISKINVKKWLDIFFLILAIIAKIFLPTAPPRGLVLPVGEDSSVFVLFVKENHMAIYYSIIIISIIFSVKYLFQSYKTSSDSEI